MTKKRKPNKLWLVVIRTNLDELPVQLFANKRSAIARAKHVTDKEADELAHKVMGVDFAGRINTAVIEFHDGIPVKMDLIEDWDEMNKAA